MFTLSFLYLAMKIGYLALFFIKVIGYDTVLDLHVGPSSYALIYVIFNVFVH